MTAFHSQYEGKRYLDLLEVEALMKVAQSTHFTEDDQEKAREKIRIKLDL